MIWRRAEEHMQWERDAVPAREGADEPVEAGHQAHRRLLLARGIQAATRMIAAAEDTSNQKLLAEALDMLFQSRKMPMIATK